MLCATHHQRTAWTDVGGVGVVRRLGLGKSVASSQVLSHGHVGHHSVAVSDRATDTAQQGFQGAESLSFGTCQVKVLQFIGA